VTSGPERAPLLASAEGVDLHPRTLDCVHCGLCLSVCPTYRETGRESSSPRGRIQLMRGAAEGEIPLAGLLAEEAYHCLGCRACETACPSGVRFGALLEATRARVEEEGLRRGTAKRLERLALREIVPRPRRLRAAVTALGVVQALGLDRLAARLAPRPFAELRALAPVVPPRSERRPLPRLVPAEGERRGRVGLLAGCVAPQLLGAVNAATARVLAKNGFEVVVPGDQGCCGALQAHAGDAGFARELLARNARAFAGAGVDALVVNSAGCGAFLREAGGWLSDGGAALAASVRDVCELLDEAGLRPPERELRLRVCYDDPCHLAHGMKVREAPRRVLAAIPGLELAAHADPTSCCGAAGIYNLTHREMSEAVLARKLAALAAAAPDVIATGNPGCILQLRAGAARAGLRARVAHPVELLDEAYR
jgi:glycolate oxidase iron-sulfur subunit